MEETQILRVKAEAHQDTARYKYAALLAGVLSQAALSDQGDSSGSHPALLPDSTLMAWKEDGLTDSDRPPKGKRCCRTSGRKATSTTLQQDIS